MTSDSRSGEDSVPLRSRAAPDDHPAGAPSDNYVIDWVPPSMEGVISVHRPDSASMRRTWHRWVWFFTLVGVLACVLLVHIRDSALLLLNTSINIESPPRMSVDLGPLRASAFGRSWAYRSDEWANEYMQAAARERTDELKQLVETLRKRRAGKEGSKVVKDSLDEGLSLLLVDIQYALAHGQLGAARDAAMRGGALLDAADLEPSLINTRLVVKLNAILLARALLDDRQLVRDIARLHELMTLVLQQAPNIEPTKEPMTQVERKRDAWDAYIAGKEALSVRDYVQAILLFRECAEDRHNPWLRDLALLGEGRAHYWRARSGAAKGMSKQTLDRLRAISAEMVSVSLRNDIGFYVDDLQERRP